MKAKRKHKAATPKEREESRAAWRAKAHRNAHKLPSDPGKLGAIVAREPRQMSALLQRKWSDYRDRCMREPRLLPQEAWNTIAGLPPVDAALSQLGCRWPEQPDMAGRTTWPEHLRWGADGVANVARLCRLGLLFGAVVLVRSQLERWTSNVAHAHSVEQQAGESIADWTARTWSHYGTELSDVARESWVLLSEWQHGRGIMPAACWSMDNVSDSLPLPVELDTVLQQIWAAAGVAFLQVRGGTWLVANLPETADIIDPDDPRIKSIQSPARPGRFGVLQASWPWDLPRYAEEEDFPVTTLPIDMVFPFSPPAQKLVERARSYRNFIGSTRGATTFQTAVILGAGEDAVRERRARAVEAAWAAFEQEAQTLGAEFDLDELGAKLFRFGAITHAARMVADWATGNEQDSLHVAASALDSAWVLWLEDTDQAMTCVRGIVEQTSRARCWRLKTRAAERLESTISAPSRWVEKAGWRRLSVLIRALGEFAHTTNRSDWADAREVLIAHNDENDHLAATARGSILHSAAYLLAGEVAERFRAKEPRLAEGFQVTVTLLNEDDHAARLEALLERGLSARIARKV